MAITIDVKNNQPAGTPSLKSQPEDEVGVAGDIVAGGSLAGRVVRATQILLKSTNRVFHYASGGNLGTSRGVETTTSLGKKQHTQGSPHYVFWGSDFTFSLTSDEPRRELPSRAFS
jgi:hypothetical protein